MNEEPKITRWIYNENGNITAVDVMYKGIGKIFYSTEPAIKELLLEKIEDEFFCGIDCGINGDTEDGFGVCTCGNKKIVDREKQLIKDL